MWTWCMTRTVVLRNMTVQLLSLREPLDISDPDVRDGNICSRQSEAGRLGRGESPRGWISFRPRW